MSKTFRNTTAADAFRSRDAQRAVVQAATKTSWWDRTDDAAVAFPSFTTTPDKSGWWERSNQEFEAPVDRDARDMKMDGREG